jgi:hypothetical protein
LITGAGSPGVAMKNRWTPMAVPGVGPLAQDGPTEPCCTAGTNTL